MHITMSNQNAQSLAKKIIRDLVRLSVPGQVKLAMGANGFVDRVRKACLVKSIEISVKKDFLARSAFTSRADCKRTLPSVSVPVLSEQITFMLPKFSIEASRL